MTDLSRCLREVELLEALESGRWPHASDGALRDHVAACAACRELETVAGALLDDRRTGEISSGIPSSGAMWWRMQLRMEREARVAAARSVETAHSAVVGLTVFALFAILAISPLLHDGWTRLSQEVAGGDLLPSISQTMPSPTLLLLAAVPFLVFAPVAVYLALAKD